MNNAFFFRHTFSDKLIVELQILDIIESNSKILFTGLYHQVNQLTLNNISKSFIFYEKLIFDI